MKVTWKSPMKSHAIFGEMTVEVQTVSGAAGQEAGVRWETEPSLLGFMVGIPRFNGISLYTSESYYL